jgi:hypothetical protein
MRNQLTGFRRLIDTSQLKIGLLAQLARDKHSPLVVHYNSDFDAFMLLVVSPETETVVHYVDDHVAFLYHPDTLEIVGLQVEDFRHSFVTNHEAVRRVWELGATNAELHDFGDVLLAVNALKPKIAREVVEAAKETLGEPGEELAAVLA